MKKHYWLLPLILVASPAAADPIDDYVACVVGRSAVELNNQPDGKHDPGKAQEIAYGLCKEPEFGAEGGDGVSDFIYLNVLAIAKDVHGVKECATGFCEE